MQLPDIELACRGGAQPECLFSVVVTPSVRHEEVESVLRDLHITSSEHVALFAHVRRASWFSSHCASFTSFEAVEQLLNGTAVAHKSIDCDGSVTFFESLVRSARVVKARCIVIPATALRDIAQTRGFLRKYLVPEVLTSTPQEVVASQLVQLGLTGCGLFFPTYDRDNNTSLTVVLNLDRLLFMDCPSVIRVGLRTVRPISVKLLGRFSPPSIASPPGMGPSAEGESWNEAYRSQRKTCEDLMKSIQKYIPCPSSIHVCTVNEADELLQQEAKDKTVAVAFQRHASALLGDSNFAHARSFVWRDENERMLKSCISTGHTDVVMVL